jgi:rod shape-determining protein MreC
MRSRKLVLRLVNLAIFILLEIASLQMLSRNADLQQIWLAKGAHGFMGTVWGSTQRVQGFFRLSRTNRELAQENAELFKDLTAAREALRRVYTDSLDAGLLRDTGFVVIPAEVVKMSRNSQHNYLILNRGYEDGIQEKSGIVTRCGVVGMIDAVSAHHSYAFSFQNADISISARLGLEGGTGLLVWDGAGSRGAILKEIPLQFKYNPGDTVYTSGHSLLFPPDIPLGVAGSSKIVNGATNEIEVTLFQDFSAIRYVSVVHNTAFDEIEEFEP